MKLKVRSEGECNVKWKQRLSIKLEHTAEADKIFLDNTRKAGFQKPILPFLFIICMNKRVLTLPNVIFL